jgi:hypothetical protein
VFVDNTTPGLGDMPLNRRPVSTSSHLRVLPPDSYTQTATRFITHVCLKSIEVSLEPETDYIVACPDVFDAVLHAGLVAAEGFSSEILPTVRD